MTEPAVTDWLRALTPARLRLGRAGSAVPTGVQLSAQLDQARARDAVWSAFDPTRLAAELGREVVVLRSQAADRLSYLLRPDLGRRLHADDAARIAKGDHDLAFVIADGLSAAAVHAHAAPMVSAISARLPGWSIAPVALVSHGRVAIGDPIGAMLGAAMVCVLIGERPGMSAHDSLGAYLTWNPREGRQDSERNCVSNIRPPDGLSYETAADTIARLLHAARRRQCTGVVLKESAPAIEPPTD